MTPYDKRRMGRLLLESGRKCGPTQLQVANRLGHASGQFLSNIERGVSVVPFKTVNPPEVKRKPKTCLSEIPHEAENPSDAKALAPHSNQARCPSSGASRLHPKKTVAKPFQSSRL